MPIADDPLESTAESNREIEDQIPDERVSTALRLGQRDLELFMATSGLDKESALREMKRNKRAGRRPSRVMECE